MRIPIIGTRKCSSRPKKLTIKFLLSKLKLLKNGSLILKLPFSIYKNNMISYK